MGVVYQNYLTIDGRSTLDFNTWISGGGTYGSPLRDVSAVSVPGRNGDIIIDNGRFQNVSLQYESFISKDFDENMRALRAFLSSLRGYKRLEDTYHPEEYRLALFSAGLEPKTTTLNRAGSFTLTFNCKPQRFLRSGELPVTFPTTGSKILNETLYEAEPVIRAYGTGTVTIGDVSVQVTTADGYTDIDSRIQEAYKGTTNCNANIVLTNGVFPTIKPGLNDVNFTGFSSIQITPNWWTL